MAKTCARCGEDFDDNGRAIQHCESCSELLFAKIPERILYCIGIPKLSISARVVYCELDRRGWKSCRPSVSGISDRLQIGRNTVIRALKELVDFGILSRESINGKATIYKRTWTQNGLTQNGTGPKMGQVPNPKWVQDLTQNGSRNQRKKPEQEETIPDSEPTPDIPPLEPEQSEDKAQEPKAKHDELMAELEKMAPGKSMMGFDWDTSRWKSIYQEGIPTVVDTIRWMRWTIEEATRRDESKYVTRAIRDSSWNLTNLLRNWVDIRSRYLSELHANPTPPWRSNGQEQKPESLEDLRARYSSTIGRPGTA